MAHITIQKKFLPRKSIANPRIFRGFWNLFRNENNLWWKSKRCFMVGISAIIFINGFIHYIIIKFNENPAVLSEKSVSPDLALSTLFVSFVFFVSIITAITITQGAIVDEKESGTISWILSKPVSRKAFILTKFFSHFFAIFILTILIPASIYFFQRAITNIPISLEQILIEISIAAIDLLFYISLSILAGTITKSRRTVLGIVLGYFLLRMTFDNLSPNIQLFPGYLMKLNITAGAESASFHNEGLLLAVLTSVITIIFFLVASLFIFEKEEI